ncbi:hypothetical protein EYF80_016460 [Liparis tanakae]|uniref:Uncharacterized protein n=1 Tax=Liparis tanakae TaxID=230148 RepID=A0A4Z2I5K6_9TELE|nr:hypothetical protein EYF80_016460 [Liparis tanakae]
MAVRNTKAAVYTDFQGWGLVVRLASPWSTFYGEQFGTCDVRVSREEPLDELCGEAGPSAAYTSNVAIKLPRDYGADSPRLLHQPILPKSPEGSFTFLWLTFRGATPGPDPQPPASTPPRLHASTPLGPMSLSTSHCSPSPRHTDSINYVLPPPSLTVHVFKSDIFSLRLGNISLFSANQVGHHVHCRYGCVLLAG